jgi:origin recognition complex subunit 3
MQERERTELQDVDLWEEHPRDIRHEESSRTGVFVVNPLAAKPPSFKDRILTKGGFTNLYENETEEQVARREQAYKLVWHCMRHRMTDLLASKNQQVFSQMKDFFAKAQAQTVVNILEIPVAVVAAGVNTSDHHLLFSELSTCLRGTTSVEYEPDTTNALVVSISARECIRATQALGEIAARFRALTTDGDAKTARKLRTLPRARRQLLDIYMTPTSGPSAASMARQENVGLHALVHWYNDNICDIALHDGDADGDIDGEIESGNSTAAAAAAADNDDDNGSSSQVEASADSNSTKVPLIIIFQDFEAFSPTVLQDMLHSLLTYRKKLPISLVFGIATHVVSVHSLLPQLLITQLRVQQFFVQPPADLLSGIFENTLMPGACPVLFDHETINFLVSFFSRGNFSLDAYLKAFQGALLRFFDSQAMSYFSLLDFDTTRLMAQSTKKQQQPQQQGQDADEDQDDASASASSSARVRRKSGTNLVFDGVDAKELLAWIKAEASDIDDEDLAYVREMRSVSHRVQALKRHKNTTEISDEKLRAMIPTWVRLCQYHVRHYKNGLEFFAQTARHLIPSSSDTIQDFYGELMSGKPQESQRLKPIFAQLSGLSPTGMLSIVELWVDSIGSAIANKQLKHKKLAEAKTLRDDISAALDASDRRDAGAGARTAIPESKTRQKARGRKQKRRELLAVADEAKRASDGLRERVNKFFHDFCKFHLAPLSTLPLHEVLFFNEHQYLARVLEAKPRSAIETALTDSYKYLGRKCDALDPNNEDICVAYQLFQNSGRLINLHDWFQSFATIFRDRGESQKELLARFMQVTAEFSALGFIKPSTRKVDHVVKLSFAV